ncbi:LacI family DNA-binding transcriptional regulator [Vallitaleaceae bacterium 9-2]
MKKRITIYDIAKELDLSPSTVSRVLGKSQRRVTPEIKQRVEDAAKRMNYYPNSLARNLKKNTNQTIGVILPSIDNPFYPSIVRGMEDEAIKHNYTINICSCDREDVRTDKYLERLIGDRVSGIITIFVDNVPESLKNFINRGGKVVSIGIKSELDDRIPTMYFDREEEAYTVTKHLIELGHKNIALFISKIDNKIREEKLRGYKKALKEFGIVYNKNNVFVDEKEKKVGTNDSIPDCNTGIFCANEMLKSKNKDITGIVCMNDLVALGAISVLKNQGYSIPKDYSVIGFDDTFFSNLIEPEITTLKVNKYEVGQKSIQYLLEVLEDRDYASKIDCSQDVNLILRKSTSKPRA